MDRGKDDGQRQKVAARLERWAETAPHEAGGRVGAPHLEKLEKHGIARGVLKLLQAVDNTRQTTQLGQPQQNVPGRRGGERGGMGAKGGCRDIPISRRDAMQETRARASRAHDQKKRPTHVFTGFQMNKSMGTLAMTSRMNQEDAYSRTAPEDEGQAVNGATA